MVDIDIRGGRPLDAPLELTGEFTGYHNGPTMQVGLWIRNDGGHIAYARIKATQGGAAGLAEHMIPILLGASPYTAPGQVFAAIGSAVALYTEVDWAQIAYGLLGSEPDEDDLAAAHEDLRATNEEVTVTDDRVYELAAERRARMVRNIVLGVNW